MAHRAPLDACRLGGPVAADGRTCRRRDAGVQRGRAAELVHRRTRRERQLLFALDHDQRLEREDLGFRLELRPGSTAQRGQEATPLVIDGVMYTSGTWGYVYAVDAASGRELWRYDPHSDLFAGRNPCCDLVNRGVAVWKGKVYVASGDGRLHAVDAATGKKLWEVDTITDHKQPYASTGAPQIAGDVVVIGNGGADMGHGGVRGYVSAYDLETGKPSNGASTRCRRPWVRRWRTRSWLQPRRPGIRLATRSSSWAAPRGTASPTIRS